MPSSLATVPTERPERYVKQLVSHLAHRLTTELGDDGVGTVLTDRGRCTLTPSPHRLELAATAEDTDALARIQDVVARHLVNFATQEELTVSWSDPVG